MKSVEDDKAVMHSPLGYTAAENDGHNWEQEPEMEPEQEQEQELEQELEHKWVEEDSCSYLVHIEDNFGEKPMMMRMVMVALASILLSNYLLPSNFIQIKNLKPQDQNPCIKDSEFRILSSFTHQKKGNRKNNNMQNTYGNRKLENLI